MHICGNNNTADFNCHVVVAMTTSFDDQLTFLVKQQLAKNDLCKLP